MHGMLAAEVGRFTVYILLCDSLILIYFILDQPEVAFGKLLMEEKLMKIFQMAILVGVLVLLRYQKVIQTLFMLEGEK